MCMVYLSFLLLTLVVVWVLLVLWYATVFVLRVGVVVGVYAVIVDVVGGVNEEVRPRLMYVRRMILMFMV